MLDQIRKKGATSNTIRLKLKRADTGQGLTGLTISSTGLNISTICDNEAAATTYTAAGSTIETISTLATFAAPTATKCRFKEVDATNQPGLYEIQLADARYAVSGAKLLRVSISGVTNLQEKEHTVQLTAVDIDDATKFGMTRVVANADQLAGTSLTGRDIGASVLLSAGTGAGQLDFTSGVVKADVAKIDGQAGEGSAFLNLIRFFTSGYGPIIANTFVQQLNSQTDIVLGDTRIAPDAFKGCCVLIQSEDGASICRREIIWSGDSVDIAGHVNIKLREAPSFTINDSSLFMILATGVEASEANPWFK